MKKTRGWAGGEGGVNRQAQCRVRCAVLGECMGSGEASWVLKEGGSFRQRWWRERKTCQVKGARRNKALQVRRRCGAQKPGIRQYGSGMESVK